MSTHKQPATAAESLLEEHGVVKHPVDVESLAATLGIEVKTEPLDDGFSAFLLIKGGKATAFVNSEHHQNRRRFSLAHEIGHFVLHHKKHAKDRLFLDKTLALYTRKDQMPSSSIDYGMEKEANTFAASLLMPENLLCRYIAKHEIDITDEFDVCRLAIEFGVSEQALQIRLNNLGLAQPNS